MPTQPEVVFGETLKRERRSLGLPARAVAEAMGLSRSRVVAIEALGRVRRATASRYMRALRALAQIAEGLAP